MFGAVKIVLVLQLTVLYVYSQELPKTPADQIAGSLTKVSRKSGDNLFNATNPEHASVPQVPQSINEVMANSTSANATALGTKGEDNKEWYNPMSWFNF
jgi:hypothetical protein